MTYMYVDCEREVGDSLSSPHVPMYMYMHIIIARKHSICTVTCTRISILRKHSIEKLIHQDRSALSFVMSTQNDQNLHWPMFSCPKKQARQNIDHRLKTAQYLLREHITKATIDLTATGAGEGSLHTYAALVSRHTDWGRSNCAVNTDSCTIPRTGKAWVMSIIGQTRVTCIGKYPNC